MKTSITRHIARHGLAVVLALGAVLAPGLVGSSHAAPPIAPAIAIAPAAGGVRAAVAAPGGRRTPELWLWNWPSAKFNNSQPGPDKPQTVGELIDLMKRAKGLGYATVVVPMQNAGFEGHDTPQVYHNMERLRQAADKIGMKIIAGVMGGGAVALHYHPNLAEGVPVQQAAFVVHGDKATAADTTNIAQGGDFEKPVERNDGTLAGVWGWDRVQRYGKAVTLDDQVSHGGSRSLRMDPAKSKAYRGTVRALQVLAVKPHREYQVSVWVKRQNLPQAKRARIEINAPDDGRNLVERRNKGSQPNHDWAKKTFIFNSLDYHQVRLSLRVWRPGKKGTVWWDDLQVRPAPGVNLVRREGCPVRVTSADGKTKYAEGKDFKKWVDPKLSPNGWGGHAPPPIRLTKNSRIEDGQKLSVSFYHSLKVVKMSFACLSHPQYFDMVRRQIQVIQKHLQPDGYFPQHDEIRVAHQCALCRRFETAGKLLAWHIQRYTKIIHDTAPDAPVYVWSDMFDPDHNALAHSYDVNTTLHGSWKGLDKSVRVIKWRRGHDPRKALKFFADRGHKLVIAGYYNNSHVEQTVRTWKEAARGIPGIFAYMYTAWGRTDTYKDLKDYARAVRSETAAGQ